MNDDVGRPRGRWAETWRHGGECALLGGTTSECESYLVTLLAEERHHLAREDEREEYEGSLEGVEEDEEVPDDVWVGRRGDEGEDPREAHDDRQLYVDAVFVRVRVTRHLGRVLLSLTDVHGRHDEEDYISGDYHRHREREEEEESLAIGEPAQALAISGAEWWRHRRAEINSDR